MKKLAGKPIYSAYVLCRYAMASNDNETNPFAIRFSGPGRKVSYILGHQPKSYDWQARGAKLHSWKQVPVDVFERACETLNQIIKLL